MRERASNEAQKMALMASRTKLSRLLTSLADRTQLLKSGSCFNGVAGTFRADPDAGFQGALFYSSAALASKESEVIGSRHMGLEIFGLKDYEDYRRSLYGEITHKALLVDAVGTLVVPSQPMAQVLLSFSFFIHAWDWIYEHLYKGS